MERRYCALSKKCKSEHVSVRLELTFPAKGHYNGFKIFRIYIPYWITRLSFSVRLLTKIRIHISETFLKRFRLYFQCIISNAQTEKFEKYYVEADRTIRPVC